MARKKRTDGGCTPIIENKYIPKPPKVSKSVPISMFKVAIEMTMKRVIDATVEASSLREARKAVFIKHPPCVWGERDLQDIDVGNLAMSAKYKIIGVEEES